jgi:hypothetical protein
VHVKNKKYINVNGNGSVNVKANLSIHLNTLTNKNNSSKGRKRAVPFLCLLLSWSAFVTPTKAMDDEKEKFPDWHGVFASPRYNSTYSLGPHILGYLDESSLRKATQVNKNWHQVVDRVRHAHLDLEKQQLYSLILDVTGAEANEVQKAHDALENYLQAAQKKGKEKTDLCNKLVLLKPRLVQPEFLIRRANESLFNQLLSSNDLQKTQAALTPLVTLIEDLQEFLILPDLQPLLFPLASHYEAYLNKLLSPSCNRAFHLHPKALLSGEGFLGNKGSIRSYRIPQEMARSLLSKDQYGLLAQANTRGSHAVCFKRSTYNSTHGVHFKGNTTNTGLPVGRESAVYALSQILFPQDAFEGRASASALLTLNEVEIKTPLEGTAVNTAFREALRDGKTSEEFFSRYNLYEKEFTQKDPSHVLQASFHVEGVSLEEFIEGVDKGTYVYDHIDLSSFSDHIFLSMLTNPTDGTLGNFMLRRNERKGSEPHETFSVVGIDNDMALEVGDTFVETIQSPFVPGQKITMQQKHSVRVKNVLYCLPLMDWPLSPQTVKRILSINPELMVLQWLERLKEQNIRYDQLQKGAYVTSNFTQARENYLSPAQIKDLHLPFLLDPNFISHICQNIRKAQIHLADHSASTHWQLLLNIHPLSSRFYQEMVNLAKGSVMKAYLKIDPPKEAPGKPRQQIPYLEDVLILQEKLVNGQTVSEALADVTTLPDGTRAFTQTLIEAAQEILSTTDLFQHPFLMPLLRPALGSFGELIQGKSSPSSKVHPSWFKEALLHKAISEGVSLPYIKRLLELGLDVTVTDKERRTTLRKILDQGADASLLSLLISFCPQDQLSSWINTIASDRLTALDIALETQHISAFKELMRYGASICHPNIALKFYRDVIKTTQDTSLKQSFLTLMTINDEVRWHVCLEEMLPPYTPKANQEGIPLLSAKFGKRLLPESIKGQVLDHNNQWKPYTQEGNHLVCRAIHFNKNLNSEHSLYFKVYPELPGIEEAVGLLTRKLLNYGAPHTELINIGGCPVLLSHSHGDKKKTLDSILRDYPHLLKNLDEESLSGLILLAMLINPEDGKPSNYVIEPHPVNPKKYRIVGIDNDHAFVPAIVTEKPKKEFFSGKLVPIAQVKTILYCLDQMKDPVHPNIRSLFINTRPDELFDEWLRELKKVNTSYSDLFPNREDHTTFFREHQSFLGVPFQKGAISHLYNKFVTLRDTLTKSSHLSHMDVLSKLETRLAKRYQTVSPLTSVKQRWDTVDAVFYEKTKTNSGTTLTRSGDILKSMDIPLQESVLESIRLGKGLGPIQALEELNKSKEVLQIKTLEALGARVKDPHILKTLQNESSRAKFLDTMDFKSLSPQEQDAILSYLKGKELRELTLKNCIPLNDNYLTQNLISRALTKLNLRGCESITYRSILHISKTALKLEELNLPHITSLQEIGDIGAFTDAPLIFKELRFFNVSNCINLTKLLIQAPNLYYLNLENCSLLNDQMLDGVTQNTKNITKLCLTGANKISQKSLREKLPTFSSTILSMFPATFPTERFLRGKLIYRPNLKSDVGRIELPIAALANPLEGTFDLSKCGDAGKYLSISTGYRKGKRPENKEKLEIWFAPRFLIERALNTSAGHFKDIMGEWKDTAPIGIFWAWGGWDELNYYDYIVTENMDQLEENDMYTKWRTSTAPSAQPHYSYSNHHEFTPEHSWASHTSDFMFVLN